MFLVSLGAYDGNLYGIQLKANMELMHQNQDDKEIIKEELPIPTEMKNDDEALAKIEYLHKKAQKQGFSTHQLFSFKATEGSIRRMANSDKYLAIGGFDEVIKIFNLKKHVEVGELIDHKGTITCLEFFQNQYLISGSEDGEIFLWRIKDFTLIYKLKAPKLKSVIDMALHPSGKL
jgi:protein MAK11